MNKKRLLILVGVALIVLLLAGLAEAAFVFAQEPTPPIPFGWYGGGRGWGGFAWAGGGPWTMFDMAADALGLTPEELFAELRAGKSLAEIAEEQGVEVKAVFDALSAARGEVMQQAVEQAVEDGRMSQEQADWMLKGLEQGFFPKGRGFGFGRRWGGGGYPEGECPCGLH
jgi:hypothetical protein